MLSDIKNRFRNSPLIALYTSAMGRYKDIQSCVSGYLKELENCEMCKILIKIKVRKNIANFIIISIYENWVKFT